MSRNEDALRYHREGRPGKIEVVWTKPVASQLDLSLAYTPGVAAPCLEIAKDPDAVDLYTARRNLVGVVTNGTAVLGLGNIGPRAAKPVMEGKAVLFKRFADIDVFDIEVDEIDPQKFITIVRALEPTFGAINLEDIRAPDCFVIERALREHMKIPVFHDDQHGTAIITAAAVRNAAELQDKPMDSLRVTCVGAGAAATSCMQMWVRMGVLRENITLVDVGGVLYEDRGDIDEFRAAFARPKSDGRRTLADAMVDADVMIGLSAAGVVNAAMLKTMAKKPIIFALANPDPEISYAEALATRPDAIAATGRSDFPNQVNNVLGFPYIFRGALDVRATTINEEMKIAAAHAIAALAREDVPDEVAAAYRGARPVYGPEYIIPSPFDPRLISRVSAAVAEAAMKSGVAKKQITDLAAYQFQLSARLDPSAGLFQMVTNAVRAKPKRVVFAEGEEDSVIRAAAAFQNSGLGKALLVGRIEEVKAGLRRAGFDENLLEIRVPHSAEDAAPYTEAFYKRIQRRGGLQRDAVRMVTNDRNIYAASMLKAGDADAMVTGVTRNYANALADVRQVLDPPAGQRPIGMQVIFAKGRVVLIADTAVTEMPTADQLADIAVQGAAAAKRFGLTPRVALLASSTFGFPRSERSERIIEAVQILENRGADFEYDGEMAIDVALDKDKLALYPFARITDTANVLIMPAIHSASISTKLLQQMGSGSVMGPLLVGLEKSVQIAPLNARMSEIYNAAVIAAYDINR